MRLYEFADDDPLRVKLSAVVGQIQSREENSQEPMPTDEFLEILKNNDIFIDKNDLFDMVKTEPLKNIVANVSSNHITFKGQEGVEDEFGAEEGPDELEKTRQQMASRQASKPSKLGM